MVDAEFLGKGDGGFGGIGDRAEDIDGIPFHRTSDLGVGCAHRGDALGVAFVLHAGEIEAGEGGFEEEADFLIALEGAGGEPAVDKTDGD